MLLKHYYDRQYEEPLPENLTFEQAKRELMRLQKIQSVMRDFIYLHCHYDLRTLINAISGLSESPALKKGNLDKEQEEVLKL